MGLAIQFNVDQVENRDSEICEPRAELCREKRMYVASLGLNWLRMEEIVIG